MEFAAHAPNPDQCMHADDRALAERFGRWLDESEQPRYATTTKAQYRRITARFLAFARERAPPNVSMLETPDVRAFLENLDTGSDGRQLSGAQFNMGRKAVAALYRMLVQDGLAHANPAGPIRPRVLAPTTRPTLGAAQLRALMNGQERRSDLRARNNAILATLINTGMRVSECARLDLASITTTVGNLTGVITKGGRRRTFTINEVLRDALSTYRGVRAGWRMNDDADVRRALFLAQTGRRLGARQIQNVVAARGHSVGLQGLSPHDLRSAAATLLFDEGVDERHIQDFMGHRRLDTTIIYIARLEHSDARAAEALARAIRAV